MFCGLSDFFKQTSQSEGKLRVTGACHRPAILVGVWPSLATHQTLAERPRGASQGPETGQGEYGDQQDVSPSSRGSGDHRVNDDR